LQLYIFHKAVAKQSGFFKQFIKERKQTGAVAPSSRYLMRHMLKPVDFKKAKIIVELGPGNGVFTKGILAKMAPDAKLFSFELNTSFYEFMKNEIKDDRLVLINDSAEKMEEYLLQHNIEQADYIISSLPLAVIPPRIKLTILKASKKTLTPKGKYIQFQYSLNAKGLLEKNFKSVKVNFTAINIPPAFVYECTNE
jgi:phosphatidylethanolamine/phosphatidyl-N-methylethanolamine N-methyltransferase